MTSDVGHIRRAVSAIMADEGIEPVRWSEGDRVLVGTKLVELMMDATGLVGLETVNTRQRGRPKSTTTLSLSPAATEWVLDYNRRVESLSPVTLPCVIPPRPWTGLRAGGYWTSSIRQWDFVKTPNRGPHMALLRGPEADLSRVMGAVNAIQETPWRINPRVLAVVKAIWDGGLDIPVLPPKELPEIPDKPDDIATNAEAKAAWKRRAHEVWRLRADLMTKRRMVVECLRVADSFIDREALYFPHHLDFRGRLYAMPRWLHPQGPDLAKGLLTFAEGKPLGTAEAARWLAIHVANTWGEDKATFEERCAWVDAHTADILATADDPLTNRWWVGADSPFCFLASCFEWAGYVREGYAFRSSLPIALDGSCNGLQHYSAMLRDPVGGAAVNLVPSDRPQDVYAEVARAVLARLEALATAPAEPPPEEEEDDRARMIRERQPSWAAAFLAFGVDRKITKRAVMVLPYGGTITSCRDYVRDAVFEREAALGHKAQVPEEERNVAIGWLGSRVWAAIGDVVVAARAGMGWLQAASRVASKAALPLSWVAPSGFVAFQKYVTRIERQVETRIHGRVMKPVVAEDTDDISASRQASALAPNFVHSLDAAALTMTVLRAKAAGIGAFAMIHDSYATHAADTEALAAHLREAFVSLYVDHDPLKDFRDRLVAALPEELRGEAPELPERGSLDLQQVRNSPFFFA